MDSFAAPENKGFAASHLAHDEMIRSFEAYKATNDERLAEIERKGAADPLTVERLARIEDTLGRQERALSGLQVKAQRPRLDDQPARAPTEHKAAFDSYVRRGDAGALLRLEEKALSVGSGADGGYTVPLEIESEIGRRLAVLSPIRAIASVRQVSAATFRKPTASAGLATGWVGEAAPRPQTGTGTLDALDFPSFELYAMPAATQQLLDDSAVDLERWIADEVEMAFAEQEGAAFVKGTGDGRPKGFLSVPQAAESAWAWGSLGTVSSGAAAGFAAAHPSDRLIDLVYALRAGYRQNGVFVMNRKTQAEIRKFKDSTGAYLWQPPAQAGGQATLLTFPVVEAEDMPDVAAGATPIAFGDFRRGYLVVDRLGLRVLRDPYSAKPYVLFYVTKRVGGGVQDYAAIKLLKIAA